MCANSLIGVEQVTGVGPVFKHWQCLVITDILYLQILVPISLSIIRPYRHLRVVWIGTWWERWVPTPLRPKTTVLQTAAFADSLLSQIIDHQSLFTLVPCYLVVWVGDMFEFLSPLEPLKLYEGVVQGA